VVASASLNAEVRRFRELGRVVDVVESPLTLLSFLPLLMLVLKFFMRHEHASAPRNGPQLAVV